jgi:hypothetical protein
MTTRSCVQCGHPLSEKAKFCAECGALAGGALAKGETPAPAAAELAATAIAEAQSPPPATNPAAVAPAAGADRAAAAPGEGQPAFPSPGALTQVGPPPPLVIDSGPAAALAVEAQPAPAAPGATTQVGPAPSPAAPGDPIPGALTQVGPAAVLAASALTPPAKRTLLALPAPAASPAAAPVPVAPAIGKRTMVGLAPIAASAQPSETTAAPVHALHNKTMLGVAIPGIAPLHAGDPSANPSATHEVPHPPNPSSIRPPPTNTLGETLPIPAFFVPPPAPLPDEPMPSKPGAGRRGGASIAVAALLAGGIALVGGAAMALLWRSAPPIAAQPRIAPDGKDVLHLTCEASSCQDGTLVSLGTMRAAFAAGEADLPLAKPLHVGDNALVLSVDRPGMGRDEAVKLVVPVAYRVRADVTTMESPHPCITIRVEAPPQTEVRVSDNLVSLDAAGTGTYALDQTKFTDGPADESRVVAIDVPYVVVPKGRPPETGTVSARIAVAPLRVDAPGTSTVIDEDELLLAGRAARGATVTVEGNPVTVAPDGAFETTVPIDAPGERDIEVRAGTATLAPRTVHVHVTRVANLADAARTFEESGAIGYDGAMRDIAAEKTGENIIVEGDVVEARGSAHRTLALVDDRRGCAKGPCLARVIIGRDLSLSRGESLRAYGRVARAYRTPTSQTVPEVEAEFVVRATR